MTQTEDRPGKIGQFAPDDQSKAASMGVPGTRLTPGVVSALDGPTSAGPEAAGALTLLHTTFADNDGAQRGYQNFAAMKDDFRTRPGFLRWLTFNDGPPRLRPGTVAINRRRDRFHLRSGAPGHGSRAARTPL